MSLVWLGNITDNANGAIDILLSNRMARGGLLLLTPGEVGWMDDDMMTIHRVRLNFERETMISRLKDKNWNETRSLARSPLRHVDLQYLDLASHVILKLIYCIFPHFIIACPVLLLLLHGACDTACRSTAIALLHARSS